MEDLLSNIQLDPRISPVGLLVILLGIRMLFAAVKTVVKLLVLVAILIGLYIFFYGGAIAG